MPCPPAGREGNHSQRFSSGRPLCTFWPFSFVSGLWLHFRLKLSYTLLRLIQYRTVRQLAAIWSIHLSSALKAWNIGFVKCANCEVFFYEQHLFRKIKWLEPSQKSYNKLDRGGHLLLLSALSLSALFPIFGTLDIASYFILPANLLLPPLGV